MDSFPFAFASFISILYFVVLGISVYCLILFIKLANRGIKALDIYIAEKSKEEF